MKPWAAAGIDTNEPEDFKTPANPVVLTWEAIPINNYEAVQGFVAHLWTPEEVQEIHRLAALLARVERENETFG